MRVREHLERVGPTSGFRGQAAGPLPECPVSRVESLLLPGWHDHRQLRRRPICRKFAAIVLMFRIFDRPRSRGIIVVGMFTTTSIGLRAILMIISMTMAHPRPDDCRGVAIKTLRRTMKMP